MKRRILFFCHALYAGGAEKVLTTVIRNLSPDQFDITLYVLHQENIDLTWPASIRYRFLYSHPSENAGLLRKLQSRMRNKLIHLVYRYFSPRVFYRFFIRGNYDVEIAFIEGYATRIISGSNNRKSKKIAWVHTDLLKSHWSKICYRSECEENEVYKFFNSVICVSQSVRESVKQLFPFIHHSHVIYNPVDEKEIIRKSRFALSTVSFFKRRYTLVSVGRLDYQKGFDRILEIMARLRNDGFDVALNIIGEGIEREKLECYISEYRLESNVNLMGYLSNPYPYIAQADIFVCASRAEGFSTVVTEALILGKPVISTCCAGVEEQLGHNNEYGYVTRNDTQSLYEGVKYALMNPNFIDKYEHLSRLAINKCSISRSMNEITNILLGKFESV